MSDLPSLCVVLPCYNEADSVISTVSRVCKTLDTCAVNYLIVAIDDGSTDQTWDILSKQIMQSAGRLYAYRLSRNFGKDAAILAGLSLVPADAYLIMDADGQHPPELLPKFIDAWMKGHADVVNGIKRSRERDPLLQRFSAFIFNHVFSLFSGIDFLRASDFKLINRKAAEAILQCGDYRFFFRGLASWIGFRQISVEFHVSERNSGKTKWQWSKLITYAIDALVLYSNFPLYLVFVLGCVAITLSLVLFVKLIWAYFGGVIPSGYSTLLTISMLSMGFMMVSLGVIGLYVKNILDQVKQRPRFVVEEALCPGIPMKTTGYDE